MSYPIEQTTKLWVIPAFDHLELFRAEAIQCHYAHHSHTSYSIGVIEAGVGGNCYQGSTYLAPPQSIVLMNPEEVHTGFSAEGLPLTYRMLYPSVHCITTIASELSMSETPYFGEAVVEDRILAQQSLHVNQPTVEEGKAKLECLTLRGDSQTAFTFAQPYPSPASPQIFL